jgi:hypothetical protein
MTFQRESRDDRTKCFLAVARRAFDFLSAARGFTRVELTTASGDTSVIYTSDKARVLVAYAGRPREVWIEFGRIGDQHRPEMVASLAEFTILADVTLPFESFALFSCDEIEKVVQFLGDTVRVRGRRAVEGDASWFEEAQRVRKSRQPE